MSFLARLIRDEDGGPLVEVAIILPILITFLFGGVDFMNALYQWNAAAKKIGSVSDQAPESFRFPDAMHAIREYQWVG